MTVTRMSSEERQKHRREMLEAVGKAEAEFFAARLLARRDPADGDVAYPVKMPFEAAVSAVEQASA